MENQQQSFMDVQGPDGKTYQFPLDASEPEILGFFESMEAAQPSAMETAYGTARDMAGTVANTAQNEVGMLRSLATGEGRTEFPDMPEVTDANIGFFESFMPNMKMGLTLDPNEKAKIIQNSFQSDPRFGGIFADAQGNPIVEWGGQPYYVNKPGASMQDANDIVAQGVQFLPAARAASGANTLAGRLASGAVTYGATDAAQQAGVVASGGKDAINLGQSGTTGAIGGAVEALAPPFLKAGSRAVKGAVDAGRKAMFPRYVPAAPKQANSIPMTQGQRSQDMNLLRREEAARQGGYGQTASDVVRSFDDRQLDAIRAEADALQPGRSGYGTEAPTDIGQNLQRRLIEESQGRKGAVSQAYTDAATLSQQAPARMAREGIEGLSRDVLNVPREMNIVPDQIAQMPKLKIALDRARDTAALASNPRFKAQNFARLEGSRKAVNNLIGSTQDATEKKALIEIKNRMDAWTEKAITEGLMEGDEATISAIKNARTLAADYFKDFGKGNMDPAGNAMVKLLDENAATPLQMVNVLTGAARTRATPQAVGLVKRMKSIFGEGSEEIAMLKDAYLMKAFTGLSRGEREVTREALVKGGRNLISGDGKQIAEQLFTPDELKRIGKLIADTAATITPQDARNSSRSAFAMMQLLKDNNLLSIGGSALKPIPFISELGTAAREAGGGITARNLTSQADRLMSAPLVEAGAAAAALSTWAARNRENERRNREAGPQAMAPKSRAEQLAGALAAPIPQPVDAPRGLLADALMGR